MRREHGSDPHRDCLGNDHTAPTGIAHLPDDFPGEIVDPLPRFLRHDPTTATQGECTRQPEAGQSRYVIAEEPMKNVDQDGKVGLSRVARPHKHGEGTQFDVRLGNRPEVRHRETERTRVSRSFGCRRAWHGGMDC